MQRRHFSTATALAIASPFTLLSACAHSAPGWQARLQQLEATAQGRLGVAILDTATGQVHGHRADERFMMLSSFKLLASALVLARVDRGQESLDRRITFAKTDLVTYSPVTERFAGTTEGMSLAGLCEATLTTSDNSAANFILDSFGGPAALTRFARALGDDTTRLDRRETELNTGTAAALLDTTTPRAMALTMQKLLLGNALSPASRQLLQQWLVGNTTGDKRLRAGLPSGWRVGDKTGTNRTDANDIGIAWPANGRPPLIITSYLAESTASSAVKEATLAGVARLAAGLVA
ncbi:D-alanyl-D-alanine carboxypeptidase family protein [Hydrogenophaga sp. RAC07]|uniref:class A beta-lactamase n=1 Tax=Hydrogenophaga sp. RAC07 TaxID=1842537 RepID=UPI00083E0328|nr:class A beta-lactamase [Hydrogenophaga sp. RAC07]AOF87368.1 D-alanyl-D-alanine carboxypeptidase family protein [Hydrogenophaga sp. RAC07]